MSNGLKLMNFHPPMSHKRPISTINLKPETLSFWHNKRVYWAINKFFCCYWLVYKRRRASNFPIDWKCGMTAFFNLLHIPLNGGNFRDWVHFSQSTFSPSLINCKLSVIFHATVAGTVEGGLNITCLRKESFVISLWFPFLHNLTVDWKWKNRILSFE